MLNSKAKPALKRPIMVYAEYALPADPDFGTKNVIYPAPGETNLTSFKGKIRMTTEATMNTTLTPLQKILKFLLGAMLFFAGVSHLTFARQEFLAQVPPWVPIDPDLTVLLSGVVEIGLGLLLIFKMRKAYQIGLLTALFFVAVFPGNISQYMHQIDAFGLDTDQKRFARLFFQPVLCLWALYSTGAIAYLRLKYQKQKNSN